ncbi:epiplakin isoform X4 [Salarias fasciatus]|uniref:epiplakin isoform X4 n=1 Tax=Salarias fasciatus TaxID=181472 RepID=UPI001176CDF9|nr:epiplakin-like isoform X4 [Salarias fasciatus]
MGDTKEMQNGTDVHGPVAGIFLEKTKEKITIYQAMKKRFLKPATALALLEAQAATVGIIDPINNKILSVLDAVKAGIVGPEMKEKLLTAEKAITGYIDPYTNQTISVFQAMQKDLVTRTYGLRMLEAQIATKGLFDPIEKTNVSVDTGIGKGYYEKGLLDNQMEELKVFYDPTAQKNVGYQTLLEKCMVEPDTGLLLLPVCITFKGLRRGISSTELLESKIIDKEIYDDLQKGKTTTQEVLLMETVKEYLQGKGSIAGIALLSTNQRMSIYEAMRKGILMPGTALVLLEAQAATGFMIDPVENKKYTVDEAVKNKLVGPEYTAKLRSAERAVTGYIDPYSGETISLFQALSKDLIVQEHGIRLLEAQIATGGIIDPINSHRLPTEIAFKRGYLTKEMNAILENSGDDTKGFFDPNTEANLTYLELMERCVIDPATGLCLLPLHDKSDTRNFNFIDYQTKMLFKQEKVKVTHGKYMGMTVSLWELLMSEYFDEQQRQDIFKKYREGTLDVKTIIKTVLEIIETSVTTTKVVFEGIRETVTAKQLVEAEIISEEILEELNKGKMSVKEVVEDEHVNMYLKGMGSIAGVLLPNSQIMTIYQARQKGMLMPGTALILLEAQAATGFVIDPIGNRKFSVDDAVKANIVGPDVCQKLRSAEKAVTGYRNPYDGKIISLFQAMQNDLIVKEHGIRLLEAQIATGGIIDPVHSHRVPVQVAYQRGYFDEEMNEILSDADDDTKGFFDPNTKENLTYLQLIERCVIDPVTGLNLLSIVKKGEFYFFVDEATKLILKSTTTTKAGGKYKGLVVSLWDLIYSRYITEEKRRELVKQFKSGAITIERFLEIILTIIQQNTTTTSSSSTIVTGPPPETKENSSTTKTSSSTTKTTTTTITETTEVDTFHGIRKDVTASELLKSKIIDEELYEDLSTGKVTVTEVSEMASVRKYLEGTNCIAGVYIQSTNQTMSIYEAKSKGLLTPGTSLVLLEAQAATGFVIDPVNNKKLSVEEAVAQGVVGQEWKSKLLSAERAVTGYKDPYTGNTISLFQSLKKDLIVKDHGIRLLEAQIATGGIIDPVYSHRVPVQVAYQRGYFDEEMNKILSDADDDTKGFFDPNTKENLTYLQLVERCITDPITGLSLLVIVKKGELYFFVDEATKHILKSKTTTRAGGEYQGATVSLWDLLYSRYVAEEKRQDLVKQFKSGAITIERFLEIILTIIQQHTTTTSSSSTIVTCPPLETKETSSSTTKTTTTTITETTEVDTFHGIRKDVTASELLESKIIDEELYEDLSTGKVTVTEVSEMASVRKYLEGTNCIAGVYIQSTNQTMSIYEAKSKGLLTPGTSLVLLEAQAATGFVIDPVNNKKLSVEEAVAQGVVGQEWKKKLLSAERAVTGYKDPYTGNTISLFQALTKDLIVKDHGIRLLEAQIATGGIIDPVYSHRVPVQVAYQRGYFDEEMNKILSDADDDTKGFFDPNTKENLTYLQLVERCITDPITGLSLLVIVNKGELYFFVDEATKRILKSKTTTRAGGEYQGATVSLWDLLYSRYVAEEKRRDLVKQFKSGAITIERFLEIILTIIQQHTTTTSSSSTIVSSPPLEIKKDSSTTKTSSSTTKTTTTTITETTEVDTFHGIRKDVTASELLKSKIIDEELYEDLSTGKVTVTEVSEMASVRKYLEGTNCIAGVYIQSTNQTMSIYEAKSKGLLTPGTSLVLLEAQAATGFVIDPVNNKKLSVEEAVAQGVVGQEWKSKLLSAERAVTGYKDPYTGNTISLFQSLKKDLIVKDHGIRLLEAQIATGGIIDPVYSHRVPVQVAYQRGYFDEEMNKILSDADDDTKGFFDPNTKENLTYLQLVERCITDPITGLSLLVIVNKGELYFFVDEATKHILKSKTTTRAGGEYQGATVSLWDLLYSRYVAEEKRQDLVKQFKSGAITIERFLEIILTIIQQHTTTTPSSSTIVTCPPLETKETSSSTTKTTTTTITEITEVDTFHGIRKDVTASELLESKIIDEELYEDLSTGKVTVTEVSEMASVRKYLEGTNCIAGVYIQSTKQAMSIYEAKSKGLLTPGTSLVLLEAQAATGFVIDPVNNKKLSVEEAVVRGVVGQEWKKKLLSAERAVTGYRDPYTGDTISLFQALTKDLIVRAHGIRLLEAQIATGGIIDPVYSHRVPVQVAYQRGYFDEEMNKILSDADDDTKGFFDPNTKENLTYLQLVERCITDPITGLSLLPLHK